jgi:hypothetical protein
MCRRRVVLLVAVATSISICPTARSDTTADDQALPQWRLRSSDLMPCNFCCWRYVEDSDSPLPPPQDLPELRRQIIAAISEINHYMLQWVWAEMYYCLDICRVTKDGHIEHL